jgi:hypothetical protein
MRIVQNKMHYEGDTEGGADQMDAQEEGKEKAGEECV